MLIPQNERDRKYRKTILVSDSRAFPNKAATKELPVTNISEYRLILQHANTVQIQMISREQRYDPMLQDRFFRLVLPSEKHRQTMVACILKNRNPRSISDSTSKRRKQQEKN